MCGCMCGYTPRYVYHIFDLTGSVRISNSNFETIHRYEHLAAGPDVFGAHVASLMAAAVRQASALDEQAQIFQRDTLRDYEAAVVGPQRT